MWVNQLTSSDRRVIVFIKHYESIRRQSGQWGYNAFRERSKKILNNPIFKQFRTVVNWLDNQGWTITWKEHHWIGYCKFVFKKLKPTVPQPGQLKNQVLLKQYILSSPNLSQKHIPVNTLETLYQQVVRVDISKHASLMSLFGLRGIKKCE